MSRNQIPLQLFLSTTSRAPFRQKAASSKLDRRRPPATCLPSNPPFLFTSSTIIRMVSLSVVSLIAIVPDSECNTPILIVPWGLGGSSGRRPRDDGCGNRGLPNPAQHLGASLFECLGTARRPAVAERQDRGQTPNRRQICSETNGVPKKSAGCRSAGDVRATIVSCTASCRGSHDRPGRRARGQSRILPGVCGARSRCDGRPLGAPGAGRLPSPGMECAQGPGCDHGELGGDPLKPSRAAHLLL